MEHLITSAAQYALDLILTVALGVLLRYVTPYVRSQAEVNRRAILKDTVKHAVAAAEKRFVGDKLGHVRKPWVQELLATMGYATDELIDAMIDSAALELTNATKRAEKAAQKAVSDATGGRVTADTAEGIIDALTQALRPPEGAGAEGGPANEK